MSRYQNRATRRNLFLTDCTRSAPMITASALDRAESDEGDAEAAAQIELAANLTDAAEAMFNAAALATGDRYAAAELVSNHFSLLLLELGFVLKP